MAAPDGPKMGEPALRFFASFPGASGELDSDKHSLLQVDEPLGLPPRLVDWLGLPRQFGDPAVLRGDPLIEPAKASELTPSCCLVMAADALHILLGHLSRPLGLISLDRPCSPHRAAAPAKRTRGHSQGLCGWRP